MGNCRTIDDIRKCVHGGNYDVVVSPMVNLRVGAAKMIKRTIRIMGRA